jgi:hypothetical protein
MLLQAHQLVFYFFRGVSYFITLCRLASFLSWNGLILKQLTHIHTRTSRHLSAIEMTACADDGDYDTNKPANICIRISRVLQRREKLYPRFLKLGTSTAY